jgi:hypothetical protein
LCRIHLKQFAALVLKSVIDTFVKDDTYIGKTLKSGGSGLSLMNVIWRRFHIALAKHQLDYLASEYSANFHAGHLQLDGGHNSRLEQIAP